MQYRNDGELFFYSQRNYRTTRESHILFCSVNNARACNSDRVDIEDQGKSPGKRKKKRKDTMWQVNAVVPEVILSDVVVQHRSPTYIISSRSRRTFSLRAYILVSH